MLLVVIALTGCNGAGIPRADLEQTAIYQLTVSVEKDEPTPPVAARDPATTFLAARDGRLDLAVPSLSRRSPAVVAFAYYNLIGDAYAQTLTVCGTATEELLAERTDGDRGLTDRVTARVTETWSGTAARDPSCAAFDVMPDSDGETVATLTFDVQERCQPGCAKIDFDPQGGMRCGTCSTP